jgi:hypothetical protein
MPFKRILSVGFTNIATGAEQHGGPPPFLRETTTSYAAKITTKCRNWAREAQTFIAPVLSRSASILSII